LIGVNQGYEDYDPAGAVLDGWHDPLWQVEQSIDSWVVNAVYPNGVSGLGVDSQVEHEEPSECGQETGEVCLGMVCTYSPHLNTARNLFTHRFIMFVLGCWET
jgi:hypothetical protein